MVLDVRTSMFNAGIRAVYRAGPHETAKAPIVLVHGLGMSSGYLSRLGEKLAERHAVWAVDLPGFGGSDRPARALDVPALAAAVRGWATASRIPPAVWVGHSLGCQVVVELAARWPGMVSGLVLAAPTVDPTGRTAVRQVGRLLPDLLREPLSLGPIVAAAYWRAGLPRVWRTLVLMMRDQIQAKLPTVHVPTLVLQGERDRVVPPAWSRRVAGFAPHGAYVVIAGAAHGLVYSKPIACAAAVEDWLALAEM